MGSSSKDAARRTLALLSSPRWLRRLARLGVVLAFALLVILGRTYHWVEAASSAERDGYVAQAEGILAGRLPSDAFRPPLYPILTATLASVFGNPFAMARLLSNFAAAGLLLCAFELGRRLRSEAVGAWALGLTIANSNLWIFGQHTTTDMTFACLAACTLLAGLAYLQRPSVASAVFAGVAYGAAALTRSNAVLLLPALGLAYYWAAPADGGPRRSWRHVLLGAACATALLCPLWLLRMHLFGAPFYGENDKNLWWKLYGNADWSQLEGAPHTGMLSLLLREPMPIARSALTEIVRFGYGVLPGLLGSWGIFGLFALALVSALMQRHRTSLYLLFALGLFTSGVAIVFFAGERLMLLWIPVAAAVIFAEIQTVPKARHSRLAATAVGMGLIGLVAANTALKNLPEFIDNHPYAEVTALRSVDSQVPGAEKLAGTAPFLGRYLTHAYVPIPDAFSVEAQRPEVYLPQLEKFLRAEKVAYLVVGRAELRRRPDCLLGGEGTQAPPWLVLIRRDRDAALWRIAPSDAIN